MKFAIRATAAGFVLALVVAEAAILGYPELAYESEYIDVGRDPRFLTYPACSPVWESRWRREKRWTMLPGPPYRDEHDVIRSMRLSLRKDDLKGNGSVLSFEERVYIDGRCVITSPGFVFDRQISRLLAEYGQNRRGHP